MATTPQTKTNPGDPISELSPEQVNNVKTIIGVGKALGINQNGIVTALAVANDESTFLNYGNVNVPGSEKGSQAMGQDHDSIGLFQQRAGDFGWMPRGDLKTGMDPVHQAAAFYGGTPNAKAPGLLQQSGWQTADPGALAQQIQQSGTPTAYYPLVDFGRKLLQAYGNTPPVALPFKPRAVGPLYVEHAVAASRATATPLPPVPVQRQPKAALIPTAPIPAERDADGKPVVSSSLLPAAPVSGGGTPTPPAGPPASSTPPPGYGKGSTSKAV